MSLLLLNIIIIISHIAIINGEIIVCDKSKTECLIDCKDNDCDGIKIYSSANNTKINCNETASCSNIQVYCGEITDDMNVPNGYTTDDFDENINECILNCVHTSCWNATLICNTKLNDAMCECQGNGCPVLVRSSIVNNEESIISTEDDGKYAVDESLIIAFFVSFFAVVLCCFSVLGLALCMFGLYYGEKKKQSNINRQLNDLMRFKHNYSNEKYEKSEATIHTNLTHKMSYLSRSNINKKGSWDTTISNMDIMSEDEKECQVFMENDDIITGKEIRNKTGNNRKESYTKIKQQQLQNNDIKYNDIKYNDKLQLIDGIEHQQEGMLKIEIGKIKNKRRGLHKKFDSEDLYIQQRSTAQQPLSEENISNKSNNTDNNKYYIEDIKVSDDDIGSDDECIPNDGNHTKLSVQNINISPKSHFSLYSMDGPELQTNAINIKSKLKPKNIIIDNNDIPSDQMHNDSNIADQSISADISAKLPLSPDPDDNINNNNNNNNNDGIKEDIITKHPPKDALLRPPTARLSGNNGNSKYHGDQISDAGSSHKSSIDSLNYENGEGHYVHNLEEKEPSTSTSASISTKCIKPTSNKNKALPAVPEINVIGTHNPNASLTTFTTYHEDEDYNKDRINPSRNNKHIRSITEDTDLQSESTFTIKSTDINTINSDLSRTTSAVAVRVAFPSSAPNINDNRHKIPFGITLPTNYHRHHNIHQTQKHHQKHRNYYSEQFYNFKPNIVRFGNNINNDNKRRNTAPNSTPPNSTKTESTSSGSIDEMDIEQPIIITSKMPSFSLVPSLPGSPCTNTKQSEIASNFHIYCNDNNNNGDIPPPPPPFLLEQKSDDTAMRSRSSKHHKKKRSKSRSKLKGKRSTSQSRDSNKNKKDGYTRKPRKSSRGSSSHSNRNSNSSDDSKQSKHSKHNKHNKNSKNIKKNKHRGSSTQIQSNSRHKKSSMNLNKYKSKSPSHSTRIHRRSAIFSNRRKHNDKLRRNHESISNHSDIDNGITLMEPQHIAPLTVTHLSTDSDGRDSGDEIHNKPTRKSTGNIVASKNKIKTKRNSKPIIKHNKIRKDTSFSEKSKLVKIPKLNGINPEWNNNKKNMMTPPSPTGNGNLLRFQLNQNTKYRSGTITAVPTQIPIVHNIVK